MTRKEHDKQIDRMQEKLDSHTLQCECDETANVPLSSRGEYKPEEYSGMNHAPGECRGTNELKKYKRNGKIITLCSCCYMFGDLAVDLAIEAMNKPRYVPVGNPSDGEVELEEIAEAEIAEEETNR